MDDQERLESLEACILAGGLSSRMGQDKSELPLGAKSLLAWVSDAARRAGLLVRVIRQDQVPRSGPLGGVYTGLKTTRADAVLFLSCDMPFVSPELLVAIRMEFRLAAEAVFARSDKWGFPFIIPRARLDVVEALLSEKRYSLQTLAERLRAVPFRVPDHLVKLMFNINTPADYAQAQELAPRGD